MLRRLARRCLGLCLLGSLALTVLTGLRLAQDPLIAPMVSRSGEGIVAATDRLMAVYATPDRLTGLIEARLAEEPRNWIALDALEGVTAERAIALPPGLAEHLAEAREADTGLTAQAGDCAACAWDIAACRIDNVLICKGPLILTPVEDLRGIAKAGVDYALGAGVDRLDLGLSVVGLGATALVVVSGGSSATLKLGTGLVKLGRGMDLLSPGLTGQIGRAMSEGIDWAAMPALRSLDDVPDLLRADALAPIAALASDLGRTEAALGPSATLHLVRFVDDTGEARRLADAATALGPRTVGRVEVLGPARVFRATLRWSEVAWQMLTGIAGVMLSLAALIGSAVQGAGLRLLRRLAA